MTPIFDLESYSELCTLGPIIEPEKGLLHVNSTSVLSIRLHALAS